MDRLDPTSLVLTTREVRRSLARSTALLDRLRRSGALVIGSTESEQFARWQAAEMARDEFYGIVCRRLRQDLAIFRKGTLP